LYENVHLIRRYISHSDGFEFSGDVLNKGNIVPNCSFEYSYDYPRINWMFRLPYPVNCSFIYINNRFKPDSDMFASIDWKLIDVSTGKTLAEQDEGEFPDITLNNQRVFIPRYFNNKVKKIDTWRVSLMNFNLYEYSYEEIPYESMQVINGQVILTVNKNTDIINSKIVFSAVSDNGNESYKSEIYNIGGVR
jgi:hypothetical protein